MSDTFVYAVRISCGRVEINKCKIIKETEKQLIISNIHGMGGTNIVKKSEMHIWGKDIVLEKNIKGYLTYKISWAIAGCESDIKSAQERKNKYKAMLDKIDSLIEKVND